MKMNKQVTTEAVRACTIMNCRKVTLTFTVWINDAQYLHMCHECYKTFMKERENEDKS